jgi:hypothetical protein
MNRDVAFIMNPNKWPRWPFLPLKRKGENGLQVGYLYGDPVTSMGRLAAPLKIYGGNIFSPSPDDPVVGEYDSADALVAAGWRVD